MKNHLALLSSLICFACCAVQAQPSEQAIQIAHKYIILDSHIDVPYRLHKQWEDVSVATSSGDFDYPRAVKGGLNVPFMSIYTPASIGKSNQSTNTANELIDSVEKIVASAPNKFAIAKTVNDIQKQFQQGLISLPMGMENGSPIQGSMENLKHFYDRGIRYITLAHSQSNDIADSSYDVRRQWHGLSPFGKKLVKEMNNLGIMVDISHVSDDAFYQVLEITEAPVIASHSSLRQFTPGFERNMNDAMLKALAKNGGVVQINFGSSFVSQYANSWYDLMKVKRKKTENKYGMDSPQVKAFDEKYRRETPFPYATIETVLDHIDHVVKVVGIDYVGIGSDFDGVGDSLPEGLKDVSTYPNLIQGLLDRGYSEEDIAKILSGNFLRVWGEVEAFAQKH